MPGYLHAGSRVDSIQLISGSLTDDSAYCDTAYSDAGINIAGGVGQWQLRDPASQPVFANYAMPQGHTLYFHAFVGFNFGFSGGSSVPALQFQDSNGYPWIKLQSTGQWYYNSGTGTSPVWTAFGVSGLGFPGDNRSSNYVDIAISLATSGVVTVSVYFGGFSYMAPSTFTQTAFTNISSVLTQGNGTEGGWSSTLITYDISTVGARVSTSRANGPGPNANWTEGAYTNVNEVITNYTTFDQSLVAGQTQSYTMGNITVPAGYTIGTVFYWLQTKNDGNSPENIQAIIRATGGTDHVSGDLGTIGLGYNQVGARYDNNPDTSLPWTQAAWNTPVQLGYESAA